MTDQDTAVGGLSAKVLECERIIKDLVTRAKQPGYSRAAWAPLGEMFAVQGFERVGIYGERMTWDDYLDFLVPWAESKEFDTRLRRVTEVGNVVFFEVEEHHRKDGDAAVINSMNVYEFDADGKICHLDVYVQGRLGPTAFNAPG